MTSTNPFSLAFSNLPSWKIERHRSFWYEMLYAYRELNEQVIEKIEIIDYTDRIVLLWCFNDACVNIEFDIPNLYDVPFSIKARDPEKMMKKIIRSITKVMEKLRESIMNGSIDLEEITY